MNNQKIPYELLHARPSTDVESIINDNLLEHNIQLNFHYGYIEMIILDMDNYSGMDSLARIGEAIMIATSRIGYWMGRFDTSKWEFEIGDVTNKGIIKSRYYEEWINRNGGQMCGNFYTTEDGKSYSADLLSKID